MNNNSKIKEFWESQAEKYGKDILATMPDKILKGMEISNISKYLSDGTRVLDLGCGNGYSTLAFARMFPSMRITGVDYSEKMIEVAKAELHLQKDLGHRVEFIVGDALNLQFKSESFDIVTTDRCLINLSTLKDQRKALGGINRVLRKGGRFVMCEDTQQGLQKINDMRKRVKLSEIPMRWHNLYIDEDSFLKGAKNIFEITEIDNFSSLYYIASRVFNAKLAQLDGKEPSYDHPLNHIASELPSVGEYGPLKIFVLSKK